MSEKLTNCCSASFIDETDLCSDCLEHADVLEDEEHECCQSKEFGFGCECYKRGPTLRDIDEADDRGDALYHEMRERELDD